MIKLSPVKTTGNDCMILIFSFELYGKLNSVEALVNGHPRDTKKVSVNQVNGAGVCFSKALVTFRAPESCNFCDFCVCIQDQSFNNFENITMKLSVNEAKLTGLWGRNCTTIQLSFDFEICLRPRKVYGSVEKWALGH